jgi:hypothetical protein
MIRNASHHAVAEDVGRSRPDHLTGHCQENECVRTMMDNLRAVLDAPLEVIEEQDRMIAELLKAMRSLDLAGVQVAQQQFLVWMEEGLPA